MLKMAFAAERPRDDLYSFTNALVICKVALGERSNSCAKGSIIVIVFNIEARSNSGSPSNSRICFYAARLLPFLGLAVICALLLVALSGVDLCPCGC